MNSPENVKLWYGSSAGGTNRMLHFAPKVIINPRRACAARVTVVGCVCVCVCLSVTLNLTSRVFVCLTKDTTYLLGNEGQNF